MVSSARTDVTDSDLYESFRDRGLSHVDAVLHVERRRGAKPPAPTPQEPGKGLAAMVGGAQGATSGFADEIIGAMRAIRDPNVPFSQIDSSIAATRQDFDAARGTHPLAAAAGHIGGGVVNPLNRILGPLTQGVGPAATGATYGAVQMGALGVGEGEGGLQNRALSGGVGAVIGGTLGLGGGYVFGRGGKAVSQMWRNLRGAFAKTEQSVAKTLGKTAAPETVQQVQEAAHRAYLQKQGFSPESIERLMETWRAGGKLPAQPPVAKPPVTPVTRPGETLAPMPGTSRGFEVTGNRATPAVPEAPTILEMQTGQQLYPRGDLGKGQTLPYYPRGGHAEQAMAPAPGSSPTPSFAPTTPTPNYAPTQQQAFVEYLGQATSQDAAARLETLRMLGVPGLPSEVDLVMFLKGLGR